MNDVTQILSEINSGDASSDQLLPLVYDELRKLATSKLAKEPSGQTLQATALVHEAYLRLVGAQESQQWDNLGHFFKAAAEAMRRILIDRARQKKSLKRGGDIQRVELAEYDIQVDPPSIDLLALNGALEKLEQQDKVKADVVKLRFFAGLTIPQTAEALGISTTAADKYWSYAKCWLRVEIDGQDEASNT